MQHTLSDHIARLEKQIVVLRSELRNPNLPDYQRSEREIALTNAEEALRLFGKALELERQTRV